MTELFDVNKKTVLITGASSGIGAHMAATFAANGSNVVLAARRREKLHAVANDIIASKKVDKERLLVVEMDINDRIAVEKAVAVAVEHFGEINVLINNAGIAKPVRLLEMTEDQWQSVMDTNLSAVWRVGQVVARLMERQKGGGAIINIASVLGFASQRKNASYGAAKSAVIHLTKSMALEWGRKKIRVNALAPGYFLTDINREFLSSAQGRQYIESLFPGRPGELSELDGPILLLASNAGSYINGSVLTVDGGTLLAGV